MDMPSPLPPYMFVVVVSSWEKASKIFGIYSSSMPIPVSFMVKRIAHIPSNLLSCSTVRLTTPGASVNFTEFPRILISTCLSFMSSPQ